MRLKVKYPCGFELEIEGHPLIVDFKKFTTNVFLDFEKCPFHKTKHNEINGGSYIG